MKKIWLIRFMVLSFIICAGVGGYIAWDKYLDAQEVLVGATWEVPLSEDYNRDQFYDDKLRSELSDLGLTLLIDKNPNYKDKWDNKYVYGVGGKNGQKLIPPIYESLWICEKEGLNDENLSDYIIAKDFTKKIAHYYKLNGEDFIEGDFEYASEFENGIACVSKGGKSKVIEARGNVILDGGEFSLSIYGSDTRDGKEDGYLFEYSTPYDEKTDVWNSKRGLMDLDGNIVLEPEYDIIEKPVKNKILVALSNGQFDQKWQYFDNNFKLVSDKMYEDATNYYEGVAIVQDSEGWKLIDEQENTIKKFIGCSSAYNFSEGLAILEYDNKYQFIDTQGNNAFSIRNENIGYEVPQFRNGIVPYVSKNKKIGLMDKEGNVVVEPIFTDVDIDEDGLVFVKVGRKAGVIRIGNYKTEL
ncbi:MAG: WG repeat-containing protein [Aminipila sp.]